MVNHFELQGDGVTTYGGRLRADGVPTSAIKGEPEGDAPSNDITTVSLTYADRDLAGGRLTAHLFHNDYEGVFGGGTFATFQDASLAAVGTLFDQSANHSEKRGFKLAYDRDVVSVPGFRFVAGLDGIRDETYQSLAQTGRLWVPETTFESLSPFLQTHQSLFDSRVNLAAGVRYEEANSTSATTRRSLTTVPGLWTAVATSTRHS